MEKGVWVRAHCTGNATCVEVMGLYEVVLIRSTEGSDVLTLTYKEWNNFRAAIKAGQFDGDE
jgi:hypothetical protein